MTDSPRAMTPVGPERKMPDASWLDGELGWAGSSEPQQVGDYLIGRLLGEGTFGKVHLAVNIKTGQKVAVKSVTKAKIEDVDDVERLYRETFILTSLQHSHIIKLYKVLDAPTELILVTEYAGGGDLLHVWAERTRFTEPEAHTYFQQIVDGVEYCHRQRVIHRDLKLENLLLSEDGQIKIADFGLSNNIKYGQKLQTNCGTPTYTCPEQIIKKVSGATADVWALGVVLFAMICGFFPFEAASVPMLFRRIRANCVKYPSYISPEARAFLKRILDPNPETRIKINAMREDPWYNMEYGDLKQKLERMPPVSRDQVLAARANSLAVELPDHSAAAAAGGGGRPGLGGDRGSTVVAGGGGDATGRSSWTPGGAGSAAAAAAGGIAAGGAGSRPSASTARKPVSSGGGGAAAGARSRSPERPRAGAAAAGSRASVAGRNGVVAAKPAAPSALRGSR